MDKERGASGSSGWLGPLLAKLSSFSKWTILGIALISTTFVWFLDVVTGPELSTSIFYLLPVALTVWFIGRRAAVVFSVAGALLWFATDRLSGVVYSQPLVPVWNAVVRLGFFLIVVFALSALSRVLRSQDALARVDALTGVANLRSFTELAEAELHRARRYGHPTSVAYFDLDDFKAVNDRLGHQEGDVLLYEVATAAAQNVRSTDLVGRLGGDEFAVLLPETSQDAAVAVMEKLRTALREATEAAGFMVTISVGCVTFSEPPETVEELLSKADRLMYAAKRAGKDGVVFESASEGEWGLPQGASLPDLGSHPDAAGLRP